METKMINTSQIAEEIKNIESIEEIHPNLVELPMIWDVCTEMYHRVCKGKPVSAVVNGVRIVMYDPIDIKRV